MKKFHWYNLIGVINICFILLVIVASVYLSGGINFRLNPISALGADKEAGIYFNLGLIVFSVAQVIFALIVCHKAKAGILPQSLFIIGGGFLVLAGYYHYGAYSSLHNLFGKLCVIFVAMGIVLISPKIFPGKQIIRNAIYTSLIFSIPLIIHKPK